MVVVAHIARIMAFFSVLMDHQIPRIIIEEEINKNRPWGYFDGSSQGDPP